MSNIDGTSTLLFSAAIPPSAHASNDASRRSPLPPSAILAALLDVCSEVREDSALSHAVLREGRSLDEALAGLPLYRRSLLSRNLGSETLAELQSLARESDPEIFFASLLSLGHRLSNEGRESIAAAVFQVASQALEARPELRHWISAGLAESIRKDGQTAQGNGPFGARIEGLLRRLARETTQPATLFGFAAGAAAFQTFRFLTLARLASAPAGFFTRAWGARALATVAATGAETLAMSFSTRGIREALGERQAWDLRSMERDLLSTGITLSLLRGSGAFAESAFRRVYNLEAMGTAAANLSGFARVSRSLFPQTAMLGALMASNRIEAELGLRPRTDGATMLVDSLATLLQFNVGARLFHAFQPASFAEWNQGMEMRSRGLSSLPPIFPSLFGPRLAMAGASPAGNLGPRPAPLGLTMMERLEDPEATPEISAERSTSALTSHPSLYREVFENAPQPVLVTDAEGDIRYANREARGIFRPSLTDLANLRLIEWFQPHPMEAGLFTWERAEGDLTYWKMESRALSGEGGLNAHFLHDVTEVHRLRTEVENLRATNARLEASSELSQRFLHDEGNLLAGLTLQEEVLERAIREAAKRSVSPDGNPSNSLQQIDSTVRDLGHTIHDVVGLFNAWKRLSRGRQQITVLPVQNLLQEALRLNSGLRARSSIQLVTDFGSELQVIQGDEALLLNAVLNLCVNACHAMPNGGTLTVKNYGQGDESVIEVSDNGTGISAEHLPKIFELGFTTKEDLGGTGIGLPNVKATIENLHGGRVEVQSEVGVGTTFRLYFPAPGHRR